jgi:hypothetical protein
MSKKIFEENASVAPHQGHAAGNTDIEKAASQLVSDIKYKVKKQQLSSKTKLNPAQVAQLYLKYLDSSDSPTQVRAIARKKLQPERPVTPTPIRKEEFIVSDIVKESLLVALNKVFVNSDENEEEVGNEYLEELYTKTNKEGKRLYHIRVTDKKTGNTYTRDATREKMSELRANPNISSVEMTDLNRDSDEEKTGGKRTAKVKAGKGLDPVGKEDPQGDVDNDRIPASRDKNDRYLLKRRAAVSNAIASRKDTQTQKEQFEYLFEINKKKQKKNEVIDVLSGKNTCVKVGPEVSEETVIEMSVSVNQQQAAGAALSAKRGKTDPSKLKGAAREMYDSMTEKQLRDFASTSHEGLPEKVQKESAECGCDDQKKEDTRPLKTKINLVKNALRARGLNMSYEPEGELVYEGDEDTNNNREREAGDWRSRSQRPVRRRPSVSDDPRYGSMSDSEWKRSSHNPENRRRRYR